jgi:transcriptional regulator with AAA-type ATPase domain
LTTVDAVGLTSADLEGLADALTASGGLLLEHADQLSAEVTRELVARLSVHECGWVATTLDPSRPTAALRGLLTLFPRTVTVPPLRHHLDDLEPLVAHLLGRLVGGARLTMSAAALNQLRRLPWPGNVDQLRQVLVGATRHRRSGEIGIEDLPAQTRSASRYQLTPLESLERDAIVEALDAAAGSKVRAAAALGLSRATIYRKIKAYGILLDCPS